MYVHYLKFEAVGVQKVTKNIVIKYIYSVVEYTFLLFFFFIVIIHSSIKVM